MNDSHPAGIEQEALLLRKDRATYCVSQNLVNCCTRNKLCNKSKLLELKGYSRPTCNKLCAPGHGTSTTIVTVIHRLDHHRVLVTTRSTCRGDIFTARCYASAVLAMALSPVSVCLSVCLSVTSRCSTKTAKLGSHKQHRTIAQGL